MTVRQQQSEAMHRHLYFFIAICFAFPTGTTFCSELQAEDAPKIDQRFRVLISAASAIDREVFEKIATSTTGPTADSFDEPSLSAELMMLAIKPPKTDADNLLQFRFLTERIPRPNEIAGEMYRSIGGGNLRLVYRPVTMIQAERITRCEATVEGTKATGSFDFHVPKLYEGSADFTAEKVDDQWRIVEFQMQTVGIHIVRDSAGKWKRVE